MFDRIYQLDPLILVFGFWRLLNIDSIYLIDITYLDCYYVLCDWVDCIFQTVGLFIHVVKFVQ